MTHRRSEPRTWRRWRRAALCLLALVPAGGAARAADEAEASPPAARRTRVGVGVFAGSGSTRWSLDGFRTIEGSYVGNAAPRGFGLVFDKPGQGRLRYVALLGYERRSRTQLDGGSSDPNPDVLESGLVTDHELDFDVVRTRGFRLSLGPV